MKEKRNILCNRIRSAKSWLGRAEDSFARQNDVQGEINLLLAQAQLQHLQENKPSFFQKNRHFLAILTAFFMALGGWCFLRAGAVAPVKNDNLTVPMTNAPESDKIDVLKISEEKIQAADTGVSAVPVNAVGQENVAGRERKTTHAAQASFSESEVRELVRAAGQALRSNG